VKFYLVNCKEKQRRLINVCSVITNWCTSFVGRIVYGNYKVY